MAYRKILIRRDTAANWTSTNPTLSAGEFGYETDTNKIKIGSGSTAWNSLGYFTGTEATTLGNLSDVTITSVSTGQVLKWNGSAWVNSADDAGTTINSLDDIGDVTITSVSNGQVLKWNGSAWVNSTTSIDGIGDVSASSPTDGDVLTYNSTLELWEASAPTGGTSSSTIHPFALL